MAERGDISINWALSPRLITVAAPSTGIIMQDLHDTLRAVEDELDNLDDYSIVSSAGKEELGGGVKVGITTTLQNAQLSFEPRVDIIEAGTVTSGDTQGKTLIDSSAQFITNGVERGYILYNIDDGSHATILEVISETQLVCDGLQGGVDDQFDLGDSYKVFAVVTCTILGGNLVAVDGAGDEMEPVFPSFGTQIVRTSASSATLQELEAIQYSTYQNAVWINVAAGQPGTTYPIGTPEYPVNNLADALTIAAAQGFLTIQVVGNLTLVTGDNVSGFTVRGRSVFTTGITADAGCITNNTRFYDCTLSGYLIGDVQAYNCATAAVTAFAGVLYDSVMSGSITLAVGNSFMFDVYNASPPGSVVDIDMGLVSSSLRVSGGTGKFRLMNMNDGTVWFDSTAMELEIDSSCTGGTVVLMGIGLVTDNSGPGCTVVTDGVLNTSRIRDQVWDEGGIMQKLLELYDLHGLDPTKPLVVTETSRVAGPSVQQSISNDPAQTVVTRL